jgi:hypothetical protein
MRVLWLASLQVPRYTVFPNRSRCVGCANNPRLPWIGLTLSSLWRLLCRPQDEPDEPTIHLVELSIKLMRPKQGETTSGVGGPIDAAS